MNKSSEKEGSLSTAVDISGKRFVLLSMPVMISFVAQNLIGIIDTAFISRLGEAALGGTAMASLVYFCIYTVGFGLSSGAQIIMGHRYGADRKDEIGHILGQSALLLALIGLGIALISAPFGKWLFSSLLSSPDVADKAVEYWSWRTIGFVFAFSASACRSFFVSTSDTKVLTYSSIVMSVVNIFLDYSLIFGHFGLPELGVKGAAIASVLAEVSGFLFYLIYIRSRVPLRLFGITRSELFRWDTPLIRQLFDLSVYLMLQAFLSQSVWTIFFFFIESLGERELAIAAIIRSIYILLFIPINSYGTAVRSTVSHIYGAKRLDLLMPYLRRGVLISLSTVLVIVLVVNLFPLPLLSIFSDDPDLIREAIPSLRVVTVALTICSVGSVFFASVGSTGATKTVFNIEAASIALYLSYSAVLVYCFHAPVWLCFTVEILYYIWVAVLSIRYITRLLSQKQ